MNGKSVEQCHDNNTHDLVELIDGYYIFNHFLCKCVQVLFGKTEECSHRFLYRACVEHVIFRDHVMLTKSLPIIEPVFGEN